MGVAITTHIFKL